MDDLSIQYESLNQWTGGRSFFQATELRFTRANELIVRDNRQYGLVIQSVALLPLEARFYKSLMNHFAFHIWLLPTFFR